jgi:hypothetical protein
LHIRGGNDAATSPGNQIAFGYVGTTLFSHAIKTQHSSGTGSGNAIDFYLWSKELTPIARSAHLRF